MNNLEEFFIIRINLENDILPIQANFEMDDNNNNNYKIPLERIGNGKVTTASKKIVLIMCQLVL